ncbi:MAG: phosphohydrolase [Waddliaceae bacterium]|nr:phosphohydrolase [Waddliaceae bacterium]
MPIRVKLADSTQKHPQVLYLYDTFKTALRKAGLASEEQQIIWTALDFATERHHGFPRKDQAQTPYIIHPLSVASILLIEAYISDASILAAAILHDTVEDTSANFTEITEIFGSEISSLVNEVTDEMDENCEKKIHDKQTRKIREVEHACILSPSAQCIKLADKLSNLHDLLLHPPRNWSLERSLSYVQFCEDILTHTQASNRRNCTTELSLGIKALERLLQNKIDKTRKHLTEKS